SWWQACRQIVRGQYDLIIWQWWTPYWIPLIWLLSMAARRAHITTIAISHQLVEPDAAPWQRWLAQVMLQRADGVIFLGDYTTRLPNWQTPWRVAPLPSHAAVVGSQIPDRTSARQRIGVAVDAQIVLCLGFVRPYKGIDTIISAMATSPHTYLLLIAGEWWQARQPIDELITRHQLTQRVIIHDHYIANEQIGDYLQAADLLVLPYRSGSVSGVATLAATVGLPIIASTVGAIANQAGVVAQIAPNQPDAWQAAITQFFAKKPPRIIPTHDTTWPQLQQAIEEVWHDCNA
ncbi:MAG: glycosyltransferase, partial [Chloroflexia bacterium]|nr:glycosyltransferase [Chloroflexia bacterium]